MKSRIARKIVDSWPGRSWRYRKSTLHEAFRKMHFRAIDSSETVCLTPKYVYEEPFDDGHMFLLEQARLYNDRSGHGTHN